MHRSTLPGSQTGCPQLPDHRVIVTHHPSYNLFKTGTVHHARPFSQCKASSTAPLPTSPPEVQNGVVNGVHAEVSLLQLAPSVLQEQQGCTRPLLVYLPGADGTGAALMPHVEQLTSLGYDLCALHIPLDNRSTWEDLTHQAAALLQSTLAARAPPQGPPPRALLLAESFGGCLALRLAAAVPHAIDRLVVINPATCFARSYAGVPSVVAATQLLGLFPEPLYEAAQAVLVPFLVDREKVDKASLSSLVDMMTMRPHAHPAANTPVDQTHPPPTGQPRSTPVNASPQQSNILPWKQHPPAQAASWRLQLLREGDVDQRVLESIQVPVLLVASAQDRMLPTLSEAARLQRCIPTAARHVLPTSSHTPLLERDVCLSDILRHTGFHHSGLGGLGGGREQQQQGGGDVGGLQVGTLERCSQRLATVLDEQFCVGKGDGRSGVGDGLTAGSIATTTAMGTIATMATAAATVAATSAASAVSEEGEPEEGEQEGEVQEGVKEGVEEGVGEGVGEGVAVVCEEQQDGGVGDEQGSGGCTEEASAAADGADGGADPSTTTTTPSTKPAPAKEHMPPETMVQMLLSALENDLLSVPQPEEAAEAPVMSCSMDSGPDEEIDTSELGVSIDNMQKWAQDATLRFTRRKAPPASVVLQQMQQQQQQDAAQQQQGQQPPTSPPSSQQQRPMDVASSPLLTPPPAAAPTGATQDNNRPPAGPPPAAEASLQGKRGGGGSTGSSGVANGGSGAAAGLPRALATMAGVAPAAARAAAPAAAATTSQPSPSTAPASLPSPAAPPPSPLPQSPQPPPAPSHWEEEYDNAVEVLMPWRSLISPVVRGVDLLPTGAVGSRPILFVGNHTLMGLYDLPVLLMELYLRGFKPRGLAHPLHWKGPLGPHVFERFGAVKATPRAMFTLMQNNQQVLLFPGGAREVAKNRDEKYQLFWGEEVNFVRLAARFGAIIVPFAAVGGDDAYDIALEVDEVLENPVLGPLARWGAQMIDSTVPAKDLMLPLSYLPGTRVPALVPIPNLERLYFQFLEPIDTRVALQDVKDVALCAQVYQEVQTRVQDGMQELLDLRAQDEDRQVGSRLTRQFLSQWLPGDVRR